MNIVTDPDRTYMQLALREARKGIGRTSPNPAVGSIVVKDGEIVGRGYHRKAGTPHAEIHALRRAGERARGGTIYVTLEPCNHTGRTPPCTLAIAEAGVKRVVVGMIDPNPLVAGSGCDFLVSRGIEVRREILADRCREINFPFIKHITTGLPWVIMKAGCSLDGRIAAADGRCAWITNDKSRAAVHRLRDKTDVILIGSKTAMVDDPSLTTRLPGKKGRDPLRVVLDTNLILPAGARMLNQDSAAPTWIFCRQGADPGRRKTLEKAGARVMEVAENGSGGLDLREILAVIGREHYNSVLVEGGGRVHGSFLRESLVDQVSLFLAPLFLGADAVPVVDSLQAQTVANGKRFIPGRTRRFGSDILIEGYFNADVYGNHSG